MASKLFNIWHKNIHHFTLLPCKGKSVVSLCQYGKKCWGLNFRQQKDCMIRVKIHIFANWRWLNITNYKFIILSKLKPTFNLRQKELYSFSSKTTNPDLNYRKKVVPLQQEKWIWEAPAPTGTLKKICSICCRWSFFVPF